jgi:hypothetical protein
MAGNLPEFVPHEMEALRVSGSELIHVINESNSSGKLVHGLVPKVMKEALGLFRGLFQNLFELFCNHAEFVNCVINFKQVPHLSQVFCNTSDFVRVGFSFVFHCFSPAKSITKQRQTQTFK